VFGDDLRAHLVPRLTTVGATELSIVDRMLATTQLSDGNDTPAPSPNAPRRTALHVAALYKLSFDGGSEAPLRQLHLGQLCTVQGKVLLLASRARQDPVQGFVASEARALDK
jgi:hypothetical protein